MRGEGSRWERHRGRLQGSKVRIVDGQEFTSGGCDDRHLPSEGRSDGGGWCHTLGWRETKFEESPLLGAAERVNRFDKPAKRKSTRVKVMHARLLTDMYDMHINQDHARRLTVSFDSIKKPPP